MNKYPYINSKIDAPIIAEFILDLPFTVDSILEIGAGNGQLKKEILKRDFTKSVNRYITTDILGEHDRIFDLTNELLDFQDWMKNLRFDLIICLETVEHLNWDNYENELFVKILSESTNNVLFSAAIPYQFGIHHVNNYFQSYWLNMFVKRLFYHHEIRGVFEGTKASFWRKQNTMLFSKQWDSDIICPPVDIISPEQYAYFIDKITLKDFLKLWWRKKKYEKSQS